MAHSSIWGDLFWLTLPSGMTCFGPHLCPLQSSKTQSERATNSCQGVFSTMPQRGCDSTFGAGEEQGICPPLHPWVDVSGSGSQPSKPASERLALGFECSVKARAEWTNADEVRDERCIVSFTCPLQGNEHAARHKCKMFPSLPFFVLFLFLKLLPCVSVL